MAGFRGAVRLSACSVNRRLIIALLTLIVFLALAGMLLLGGRHLTKLARTSDGESRSPAPYSSGKSTAASVRHDSESFGSSSRMVVADDINHVEIKPQRVEDELEEGKEDASQATDSIVFLPLRGIAAAALQNVLHRVATSRGMHIALPISPFNLTYHGVATNPFADTPHSTMMCSGYLDGESLGGETNGDGDMQALSASLPSGARIITVLGNPQTMASTTSQLPLLLGASPLWPARPSIAAGLGLDPEGNVGQNMELAEHVLDFVLLEDRLDESLVLLKRRYGWQLDDIVYCRQVGQLLEAPRLGGERWGPAGKDWYSPNPTDRALYAHYRQMHEDAVLEGGEGFAADLAAFRHFVDLASDTCAGKARYGQDALLDRLMAQSQPHPAAAAEGVGAIPHCDLLLAETSTFVRYFYRLRQPAGAPPVRHIGEMGGAKPLVWIKTHKTGSSTMTNVFHRIVTRQAQSVAVPADNLFIGWPKASRMVTGVALTDGTPFHFDAFGSGHSRYDRPTMELMVPEAT